MNGAIFVAKTINIDMCKDKIWNKIVSETRYSRELVTMIIRIVVT